MGNPNEIWQKQRLFLDEEKKKNPGKFLRDTLVDDDDQLKAIGITALPKNRPTVYIRLWPQDFIVEEITQDGVLHNVAYNSEKSSNQEGLTVYADLIKVGVSTLDVIDDLSKKMEIDRKQIGYAGIKDRDAITVQQLSFRNVDLSSVNSIASHNYFLKNIYSGKGALQIGDLIGNKFTLVLRCQEKIDASNVLKNLNELERSGFWNFFYTQRFGTPRLISHFLGLELLNGNYENCLKIWLTFKSKNEIDFFSDIRDGVIKVWGRWSEIKKILTPLSYTFRREIEVLQYLENNPGNYAGALKLIEDQIQLWVFAYASYLFNKKLSEFIKNGSVPEKMPLFLSRNPADWGYYKEYLAADDLMMPSGFFRDFPGVQLKDRSVETAQKFEFHEFKVLGQDSRTAVISFTLPKGSYATTLLAHLFTTSGNIPVLQNIYTEQIDAKEILGEDSIQPIVDVFKSVIYSKLETKESEEQNL